MKIIKTCLLSLLLVNPSISVAGEAVGKVDRASAGGWDQYYSIKTTSTHNPANCPNNPNYWFFEKSNEYKEAWLSIAMTAHISTKDVSGYIDDSICLNGYPKLRRLTLGGAW